MIDEDFERHVRAIAAQIEEEHPDLETELFPYAEGTLPSERAAEVEEHLAGCRRCREDVEDARGLAPPRSFFASRLWKPVMAIAATVVAIFLLVRDPVPQPLPAPRPTVSVVPSVPVPPQPRYARAEWETLVRDARGGAPLALPDALTALRGQAYQLRGSTDAASKLEPAGVVVETVRPELRWPAPKDAHAIVTVFAGDTEVARSGELATNTWTPAHDLPRGVTYTWQVELTAGDDITILPSPPAPPARFLVLDAATAGVLDEARRAHGDDPLLLGLLYARAGLVPEARKTLERVHTPEDAPVAQRLLRQLPP